MKNDKCCDGRFGIWIVLRVIFAIVVAIVVLGIIFNILFGRLIIFYTGWIWNLLGILIFIWFISWIFRWPWRHEYWNEREMWILRRRYAKGNITEAQFKRMMKVLKEERSSHKH